MRMISSAIERFVGEELNVLVGDLARDPITGSRLDGPQIYPRPCRRSAFPPCGDQTVLRVVEQGMGM